MIKQCLLLLTSVLCFNSVAVSAGLQTTYGSSGLTKIVYNGTTLMDASVNGQDAFTIWEYRLVAGNGSVQGGWGETNVTRSWDSSSNTLTWAYSWGTVQARYVQSGDTLLVSITVSNTDPSLTVEGLNIYPFYLHFPQLPSGFVNLNYPQIQFNTDGPGVTGADYGSGVVVMANEDASKPLYTGFSSTGSLGYHALIGSTYNSGQASFWPKLTRPIPPRSSDTYRVSFRFAPSGTPISSVAGDIYNNYRTTWPYSVNWPDRRPVGAIFLSTGGTGDDHRKAGFPTNPRRYFNDPSVDVTTPAGLAAFQQRVLAAADFDVSSVKGMNGQGMITWDIEGEEYPQETSYVCDPQKLGQLAPEMESTLPNGTKLIDAYFKKFKDAGLKTGVCVRPQSFTVYPDGTADQVYLDANLTNNQQIISTVANNLIQKIKYARDRWGVSIIYVDSAVNVNRGPLEAAVFRAVLQAYPDLLIIPEEHTAGHEGYSAGWKQPGSRPAEVRTTDDYKLVYPQAFSVVYVADAPVGADGNLAQYPQYVQGVQGGDILLFRAFYQDSYYDGQVSKVYASAGVSAPASTPSIISFSSSQGSISAGSSTVLSWSVSGATSLSISPSPGVVTGSSVTVTPASTTTYTLTASNAAGTVQSATTVTVVSAPKPPAIISFSGNPASITAGDSTVLSWNVSGANSVSISPSPGTVTGSSVTVTPGATTTYTLTATNAAGAVQSATTITVASAPKPPAIVSFNANPASITAGGSTVLSWNVTGANSVSISPSPGIVTGSSVTVAPGATTTYTLTATNATGTVQSSTTVTVVSAPARPAILSFTASPSSIIAGSSTVLSWNVTGATTVSISPLPGLVTGSTASVAPGATVTYILTATNAGGTSQAATTVTVGNATSPGGTSFVTGTTAHTLRNDYSGWVGMKFTVGGAGLNISALGRYAAPGNTGLHVVKLVRASDGGDVPGGAASLSMAGSIPGQFKFAALPAALTLAPGATYFLLSQEFSGGEQWYDVDRVTTTQDASVNCSEFGKGPGNWTDWTSGPNAFGPVSFAYTVPSPGILITPAAAAFVTSVTPRILRNDYTGWIGMSFTTGPLGMNVVGLGRYSVSGNSRSHLLKLVRASDGGDVSGGTVAITMAGKTPEQFAFATLASPVFLQPNTRYHLVTQEISQGDQWYDQDSIVTTSDAAVNASVYGDGTGRWISGFSGAKAFGPVTLTYTLPAAAH